MTARQGPPGGGCLCLNPRHRLLQRLNSGMRVRACGRGRSSKRSMQHTEGGDGGDNAAKIWSGRCGVVSCLGRGLRGGGWCSGVSTVACILFRWTCVRLPVCICGILILAYCISSSFTSPSPSRQPFIAINAFSARSNSSVSIIPLLGVVGSLGWTIRPCTGLPSSTNRVLARHPNPQG